MVSCILILCLECDWMILVTSAPSSPPENLNGEVLSSSSVYLQWDVPPPEHQNGIITGYFINVTALETGTAIHMSTANNNVTFESLQPFTTYFCIVAARTSAGKGPYTTAVIVQTLEDGKKYTCQFQISGLPFTLNYVVFSPI